MTERSYTYIIVGGGLAGASAVEGIRELDKDGDTILFGKEPFLPYDRPPLTKDLWFGRKEPEEIFVHGQDFYNQNHIEICTGTDVVRIDPVNMSVVDEKGNTFHFQKLLLATGGVPRRLSIPGGDIEDIVYYRTFRDYQKVRRNLQEKSSVAVIGNGFIGSELSAALNLNGARVTMIFPSNHLLSRVIPEGLGLTIQAEYQRRGIKICNLSRAIQISTDNGKFQTHTDQGQQIESDQVIAAVGIEPATRLAEGAELAVANGIVVNDYLQSSNKDIYAAGDNALFPYRALGQHMRIEHWDNALHQGRQAGRNMAGAHEPYTYMPNFFSDLFDFTIEAVGDVSTRHQTVADWKIENNTGIVYYLEGGKVKGVLMCNVEDKADQARELIQRTETVNPESLIEAIR